jgi:hypothetical protein
MGDNGRIEELKVKLDIWSTSMTSLHYGELVTKWMVFRSSNHSIQERRASEQEVSGL